MLPPAIPTPRQLLIDARALIANPDCWTQGSAARDKHRCPLPANHADAVAWCATGALTCATWRHTHPRGLSVPLQQAFERACDILAKTVRDLTLGRYTQTTVYNDATNHGCIMHTYDIAIADAAPSPQPPPARSALPAPARLPATRPRPALAR